MIVSQSVVRLPFDIFLMRCYIELRISPALLHADLTHETHFTSHEPSF